MITCFTSPVETGHQQDSLPVSHSSGRLIDYGVLRVVWIAFRASALRSSVKDSPHEACRFMSGGSASCWAVFAHPAAGTTSHCFVHESRHVFLANAAPTLDAGLPRPSSDEFLDARPNGARVSSDNLLSSSLPRNGMLLGHDILPASRVAVRISQ